MKTYIVFTSKGMVATIAENKGAAYNKVLGAFPERRVAKTSVTVSSCHLDYVSCEKL